MASQPNIHNDEAPTLHGARTVQEILRRTGGQDLLDWLKGLGFWVDETKRSAKAPPQEFSSMRDAAGSQLSDLLAYWSSEYARSSSILGALQGEQVRLKVSLERAQAEALLEVVNEYHNEGKKIPSQRILDAHVQSSLRYQEARNRTAVIEQALKAVAGVKEAAAGIRDGVSREITRRGDLLRGRIE